MKKNKIFGIEDWERDKNYPDKNRHVDVRIFVKSLDYKEVLHLPPSERKETIIKDRKDKIEKLVALGFFKEHQFIGTKRKPHGVETKVPFGALAKLQKMDFIWNVFIEQMDHAREIKKVTNASRFFCIRMTIAIEIEGATKGMQTYEERFVLIKAKSSDQAYSKIEKTKKDYSEPYLNSDGHLVRWRIESLDDCYETYIEGLGDIMKPEGAEVFSVLKKRKLTPDRVWDGKLD